ncbi:DUF6221 family protein [Streptomyces ardesiacus]|uniref:DUF6221 family protein n=1 Tax=Streptomyces ardesiacus TaxID=285564 RepID=UPI00369221C0
MTADLLTWLETAITAREEAARKAAVVCGCHPPVPAWSFRDGDGPTDGRILVVDDPHPGVKRKISRRWNGSYEGLFMAQHVVLHDPESVLRRCAADRKLLKLHQAVPDHGRYSEPECPDDCDGQHTGPPVCMACRDYAGDPLQAPCQTLLAVAEGYGWTEG